MPARAYTRARGVDTSVLPVYFLSTCPPARGFPAWMNPDEPCQACDVLHDDISPTNLRTSTSQNQTIDGVPVLLPDHVYRLVIGILRVTNKDPFHLSNDACHSSIDQDQAQQQHGNRFQCFPLVANEDDTVLPEQCLSTVRSQYAAGSL
jgi:hypothetical protein